MYGYIFKNFTQMSRISDLYFLIFYVKYQSLNIRCMQPIYLISWYYLNVKEHKNKRNSWEMTSVKWTHIQYEIINRRSITKLVRPICYLHIYSRPIYCVPFDSTNFYSTQLFVFDTYLRKVWCLHVFMEPNIYLEFPPLNDCFEVVNLFILLFCV